MSDGRSSRIAATFGRAGERLDRFWTRHGRTFWVVHSIWALLTGALVLWFAHERYDFVYWVLGFLGLTWVSTLFFSRPQPAGEGAPAPRLGRGLASYLTRVLYQETLFFLLPFYAYSAVVPSWNLAFVIWLALLAILACLDLVFDRWLRASPAFGLVFFASVAFAALNLLLPMLASMDPVLATPVSVLIALLTAAPICWRSAAQRKRTWLGVGVAGFAMLGVTLGFPQLIPAAPLRLQELRFAAGLEAKTLVPIAPLRDGVADRNSLDDRLVVVARVFAPARIPARVSLDWYRDDLLVRSSREVDILAHEGGFRLWDALRAEGGELAPGSYRVVLRSAGRAFGSAKLLLR